MGYRGFIVAVTMVGLLITVTGTAGCTILKRAVHRIDVNQGNYLEERDLRQLKRGMSKEQVIFLLGTPMVNDLFGKGERWLYLFRQQVAHQAATQQQVKLTFDAQGRLATIEGDLPAQ